MGRYIYSFLIDGALDHAYKASLLVAGLRHVAHVQAGDIVVHHTDKVESDVQDYFRRLGCVIRQVNPYLDKKYCNKLRQLEGLETVIRGAIDGVFLLDIDLAIVGRLNIPDPRVCWGKIVDAPNPPVDVLMRIYDDAGIKHPEVVPCGWGTGQTFKNNLNGGFLYIPWRYCTRLHAEWSLLAEQLFWTKDLLCEPEHRKHIDQITFGMALSSQKIPYRLLGADWNYPCHRQEQQTDDPKTAIRVLHYHSCLDEFGRVLPTCGLDDRIQNASRTANDVLKDCFDIRFFERLKREQAKQFAARIVPDEKIDLMNIRSILARFSKRLRFILHAGTPKTGTSSLQWHLGTNREILAEHGIWYPQPSPTPMPKHQRLVEVLRSRDSADLVNHLECALADMPPNTHTIVMTTEGIFNHWWDFRPESIGTLKAIAQEFDFELWTCFREPKTFAESLYAQYLTNPNFPGVAERVYGLDISFSEAMGERWFRRHLDYTGFIYQCQEVFGKASVYAFAYHGSIAEALARRVIDIELPTMPRHNTTMRSPGIEIVRIVNRYKLSIRDKVRAENLILKIDALIGEQALKFSISDEDRQLVDAYTAPNWSIAQSLFIRAATPDNSKCSSDKALPHHTSPTLAPA
ncbi:MAG: hypothetical protein AB7S74_03590 [Hyphomicrobium sp.]